MTMKPFVYRDNNDITGMVLNVREEAKVEQGHWPWRLAIIDV